MAPPQRTWLYGWSIAHVQRYLLAANALRDIQGGSQLLEELAKEHFGRALDQAGLPAEAVLSRAAAGARVLSADEEALRALYAAWPAVVDAVAPGAQVDQALVPVDDGGLARAHRRLGRQLVAARSAPVRELPQAGPLVARCRKTALPAERWESVGTEAAEPLDRGSLARLDAWRSISDKRRTCWLDEKFLPDPAGDVRFASGRDADTELTRPDDPYVAVVHADGNGVGALVARRLDDPDAARGFREFSERLSAATCEAARVAVEAVLAPEVRDGVLPARPVVLGGDDVTVIVRGDLGIRFAASYLEAFEAATARAFGEPLTACAGVAVVKARFPFDRAHDLAESLCGRAKKAVKSGEGDKAAGSALSFHRVTTSLPEGAEDVFGRELASRDGAFRASFEAYGVGRNAGAAGPSLAELRALADAFPSDQKGALRNLITHLVDAAHGAQPAFDRLCELLDARRKKDSPPDPNRQAPSESPELQELKRALGALTGTDGRVWTDGDPRRSPLGDAFLLRTIEGWRPKP